MKKKLFGIFITLLFFVFILHKININTVYEVIKDFSPNSLFYITIFYVFSLLLRGIRWKLFLANKPKYSWFELAQIFTIGTMFNIFLPARAGDVYRAYYLGHTKSEKKLKIFGSVILERVFDGLALFFILFFAVLIYFKSSPIINSTVLITGLIFIGSLIIAIFLLRSGKLNNIINKFGEFFPHNEHINKICKKFRIYTLSFLEGFEILTHYQASLGAFLYSLLIWIFECSVAFLIINSFGISFPISASLFVISLITFSTMIPSTSIFLGPFQVAYILALSIYGAEKELALAISLVHNIILTVIISLIGTICFAKFNLSTQKNNTNS